MYFDTLQPPKLGLHRVTNNACNVPFFTDQHNIRQYCAIATIKQGKGTKIKQHTGLTSKRRILQHEDSTACEVLR